MELRRILHARGLRYRVDACPVVGARGRADLVFPGRRVAVYVNGCFWHGCELHGTWPKANADWWRQKIENNRRRDAAVDEFLVLRGWSVIRVWEHDDPELAARRIEHATSIRTLLPSAQG